jgi:hypothetical protein
MAQLRPYTLLVSDELPIPPDPPARRVRRGSTRLTGKVAGAGLGAVAGSLVANPLLGAAAGAAAGETIETAIEVVLAKVGRDAAVPAAAIVRFATFLAEYREREPERLDEVIQLAAGEQEYMHDALTTYAALHKSIALSTQGVRQEVLMRGLAHFATSDMDVATFSHAVQTVTNLTRRQLGYLAMMSREGGEKGLGLSEFAHGRQLLDPFAKPDPADYAVISRHKELHELISRDGLVVQVPSEARLEGLAADERAELIRSLQPRDWSEIEPSHLQLSAAGHVLEDALDLGQLGLEIQQELLKELDPLVGMETFIVPDHQPDPAFPRPFDWQVDMQAPPQLGSLDQSAEPEREMVEREPTLEP